MDNQKTELKNAKDRHTAAAVPRLLVAAIGLGAMVFSVRGRKI